MAKKVLIFSLSYFPKYVGGAEIAIKEITDRIDDIEFHLITLRFDSTLPAESKEGNVHVHRIGYSAPSIGVSQTFSLRFTLAKVFFIPRAAWKAWRLHQIHQFDGAWAMMSYMQFPLALLRLFGIKIPYAITIQEGDPFEHVFKRWRVRMFKPLLSYGFTHAVAISTISTFLAEWAKRLGFSGPIQVIPNAVDTDNFMRDVPQTQINDIADTLEKKMGDVFLITTSRLVHKNAVDDVIRALPLLSENVHFIVLGTGPDEVKLKDLVRKLKVADRVQFVGHVEHREMPQYLKACDIFIRPSRSEGMGNSFVEAMAAGLPVIATQEGGLSDFIFDEKRNPDQPITAWAVDKDSPEQIAEAVRDIMSRQEKARAVVATAREMVREKFNWDLIADLMRTKIFARVLGE